MDSKKLRRQEGASLLEIMLAIMILAITVIGTSGYRYHSILDTKKANARITAARTALLLCESWHGTTMPELFDPVSHLSSNLSISSSDDGPSVDEDYTLLGNYAIVANDATHYATLSWGYVQPGLRALNVTVAWPLGNPRSEEYEDADREVKLTTYTTH